MTSADHPANQDSQRLQCQGAPEVDARIAALSEQIQALKQQRAALWKSRPREVVPDCLLTRLDGSQCRLSDLFGDRHELIVIHNMGRACPYCSLWADGFIGVARHLESRSAFVLCSKDPPEVSRQTVADRGWPFTVVCNATQPDGRGFSQSLGFGQGDEVHPGISTFRRERTDSGDIIWRTGHAPFGPGDDFCAVWPTWELLGWADDEWKPPH